MTCHAVLKNSVEHKSLETCGQCHTTSEAKKQLKLFDSGSGCGDRCFSCHNEWPKNGYHAPLDTCLNCHNK